jgi:hypothetical protein
MIYRVSRRRLLSGNKLFCVFEIVLRNDFFTSQINLFQGLYVLRNIFRVEIREYRVEIKQKKGSTSIPFFVRIIKNITEFIAEGDSYSIISTLLYSLCFILCALMF